MQFNLVVLVSFRPNAFVIPLVALSLMCPSLSCTCCTILVTCFIKLLLVVVTPATSSWVHMMHMAYNFPFSVETVMSNLMTYSPSQLIKIKASSVPPNFHPFFKCLEMLNKLNLLSGTKVISFIKAPITWFP